MIVVSFNSCVLYLSCYIGILVTCAVTCVDFVLCSVVVYCVCYVSVWMCHDSCCLIVLNIVLILYFFTFVDHLDVLGFHRSLLPFTVGALGSTC